MFQGKLHLSGIFTTLSGMSIGHDKNGNMNGAMVRAIVRHPITQVPFIPGSSFRGAVRQIFEKEAGQKCHHKIDYEYAQCPLCQIFGISEKEAARFSSVKAGRATFRDSFLTKESLANLQADPATKDLAEIRIYAGIDRITAQGNLYAIEQIPAFSQFEFSFLFTIYEKEDCKFFRKFLEALILLSSSSIGSQGSRGLGKIRFGAWPVVEHNLASEKSSGVSLIWRSQAYYETGGNAFETLENLLCAPEEKNGIEDLLAQVDSLESWIG